MKSFDPNTPLPQALEAIRQQRLKHKLRADINASAWVIFVWVLVFLMVFAVGFIPGMVVLFAFHLGIKVALDRDRVYVRYGFRLEKKWQPLKK